MVTKKYILLTALLLFVTASFTRAKAPYGTMEISWDTLAKAKLPDLDNHFWIRIELKLIGAPVGCNVRVSPLSTCGNRCEVTTQEAGPGIHKIEILNVFGYGEEFSACNDPVEIEFGIGQAGDFRAIHSLPLHITGSRSLPFLRIGEVAQFMQPPNADYGNTDTLIFIYPQIQILNQGNEFPRWCKPVWEVNIELPGIRSFRATGWNDCSGKTKGSDYRSPCKPDAVHISALRVSGPVKISFHPSVHQSGYGKIPDLQFETDTLSFWYDVLADKRVEK